ncbi:MAG: CheR family methyltransferase [Xenococcaceae cyanobacterium]
MNEPPFDFEYLRGLVRKHSAVMLEPDKDYLAKLHLEPLAISAGFNSIASLIEHLKRKPFGELHISAIEALITNETSFFRDKQPFETLKSLALPTLIERRKNLRFLNIWCAACSSGQEPYSIAMLIREHFPILRNWQVRIIASDLSGKILTRARSGRYNSLEINRGLPVSLRDRYFQRQGREWILDDEIRQMVEFSQINLIHPWTSLPQLDIIFLRNVLIYFETNTKQAILRKVRQQLKPDGYLFLGSGETTIHLDPMFESVRENRSLYHRLRLARTDTEQQIIESLKS